MNQTGMEVEIKQRGAPDLNDNSTYVVKAAVSSSDGNAGLPSQPSIHTGSPS